MVRTRLAGTNPKEKRKQKLYKLHSQKGSKTPVTPLLPKSPSRELISDSCRKINSRELHALIVEDPSIAILPQAPTA
jgi:hypothetical protein